MWCGIFRNQAGWLPLNRERSTAVTAATGSRLCESSLAPTMTLPGGRRNLVSHRHRMRHAHRRGKSSRDTRVSVKLGCPPSTMHALDGDSSLVKMAVDQQGISQTGFGGTRGHDREKESKMTFSRFRRMTPRESASARGCAEIDSCHSEFSVADPAATSIWVRQRKEAGRRNSWIPPHKR